LSSSSLSLVVVVVGIIVIVFPPAQNVVQHEGFLPPCRELKAPVLPAMIRSSSGLNKTLKESGIFPILLYRRLRDTGSS